MSVIPAAPPRVWGRGLVAVSGRPFEQRVAGCYSARHLAAALAAERGRPLDAPARDDRIDRLTERLSEVRDGQ